MKKMMSTYFWPVFILFFQKCCTWPFPPPIPSPTSPFLHSPLPVTATWVIISLFKTLFLLSITRWSFRSPAWSNTPQRFTWNRGHAQLIHHSPPATPLHPSPLLHSCTFWSLFIQVSILYLPPLPSLLISWLSRAHLSQQELNTSLHLHRHTTTHSLHARNPNLITHKLSVGRGTTKMLSWIKGTLKLTTLRVAWTLFTPGFNNWSISRGKHYKCL